MLKKEDLQAALDAYENANENGPAAAKSLGIKTTTFYYQLNLARANNLIVNI